MTGVWPRLAAVAKPGGDAVDGEMDGAQQPLVLALGAMASQELDLQVVERIEIGEAVADRAGEGWVLCQKFALPGDRREKAPRALPLRLDAPEHVARELRVANERGVARADGEIGLGEHHVHIGKHAAEKGPGAMHLAQLLEASLARGEPALDRGAEPVPPGQHEPALAPAEHPRNGAQVLDRFARFARSGAAADVQV